MLEYFPDPYPDELLYSVWARYSDLVNYSNRDHVFEELFGQRRIKPISDLPCHLGRFFERLPFGHNYSLDILINHHTLLPFYAPFLPMERFRLLREQMINGNGTAIQYRVGRRGVHVPLPFWLRYCPACVEEDRAKFGECYWHRLHQVTGVEICPLHAVFLENSKIYAQSTFATKEFSSAEKAIQTTVPRDAKSFSFYSALRDIAQDAAYLLEHLFLPLNEDFLQKQYYVLLERKQLLTSGGLVNAKDLTNSFVNHYSTEILRLFNCEIQYDSKKPTWLTTLSHYTKRFTSNHAVHPFHHLLAIHFLGSTLEEFLSCEFREPQPFGEGPWPCLNPVCEHYQQNSIDVCQIRKIASKGPYMGKFACDCGFIYSRYSHVESSASLENIYEKRAVLSYGKVWETKLRELWLDRSIRLKEISQILNMSEEGLRELAVKLHLPVPRRARQPDSLEQTRSKYRNRWLSLLEKYPEETAGQLGERSRRAYIWLLHNDAQWLNTVCPPRKLLREGRKRSILYFSYSEKNKEISDVQVVEIIKSAAHAIASDPGHPKRITIAKLKMHSPELIPLLRFPERKPIVMQALKDVIETHEAFAIRRIKWTAQQYIEEQTYPSRGHFMLRASLYHLQHIPQVQAAFEDAMAVLAAKLRP